MAKAKIQIYVPESLDKFITSLVDRRSELAGVDVSRNKVLVQLLEYVRQLGEATGRDAIEVLAEVVEEQG